MKNDVFGAALKAFSRTNDTTLEIEVFSELAGDEQIPVSYLFRTLDEMPLLEQKALDLCNGRVLDVGACAGVHSLVLQDRGVDVTALEKSSLACDVLEERGVEQVLEQDFYQFSGQAFDTVLLLMNGVGLAGRLEKLDLFLMHCKSLLAKNGKILLESADIIYMYEDEDGSYLIDINGDYYGNMNYTISFEETSQNFDWLYVSFDLLQDACKRCGLKIKKVVDGEHYDYLAEIWA
jgi:cyclopropane fatty-acyl-phospholipid synthase-like methyltransferase